MANTCGDCLLFQGANNECDGGRVVSSSVTACPNGFKGPASLFDKDKCGCCRLFEGPHKKCGGGKVVNSSVSACPGSFAPIPG